jgi:hypothetical protein
MPIAFIYAGFSIIVTEVGIKFGASGLEFRIADQPQASASSIAHPALRLTDTSAPAATARHPLAATQAILAYVRIYASQIWRQAPKHAVGFFAGPGARARGLAGDTAVNIGARSFGADPTLITTVGVLAADSYGAVFSPHTPHLRSRTVRATRARDQTCSTRGCGASETGTRLIIPSIIIVIIITIQWNPG